MYVDHGGGGSKTGLDCNLSFIGVKLWLCEGVSEKKRPESLKNLTLNLTAAVKLKVLFWTSPRVSEL